MRVIWEFLDGQKYRLLHNLGHLVIPLIEKEIFPKKKNYGVGLEWKWHDLGMSWRRMNPLGEEEMMIS